MKLSILPLLIGTQTVAACTSELLVDNYANYPGTNAVGGYSSDDSSCNSTTPANGVLSILPGSNKCYFYTNFPNSKPEDATGGNRTSIQFTLNAPTPTWSFKINIKSWNGTNLADSYYTATGPAAGNQVVTAPLASFGGPDVMNPRNIRSLVFESFSDNSKVWKFGEIVLPCSLVKTTTTTSTPKPTSTTTSRSTSKLTTTATSKPVTTTTSAETTIKTSTTKATSTTTK